MPSHVATAYQEGGSPASAPTPVETVVAPTPAVEKADAVETVVADQGSVEAVAETEEVAGENSVNNGSDPNAQVQPGSSAENPMEGSTKNQ